VRGHGTGWYPYPFLNPAENGYFQVVVTGVVIAAAMVIFVAIATWSTSIRAQAKT